MNEELPKFTSDKPVEIRIQIPCRMKFGNVEAVDIRIPVSRELLNDMPKNLSAKSWFMDAVFESYFAFLKRNECQPV